MTETYKIINGICSAIIANFFLLQENIRNLRNLKYIPNENRETVKHKIETITNRNLFSWANLPNEHKLAFFFCMILNRK